MILVTKVKMRPGCWNSRDLTEIDSVYLTGLESPGFYSKESIHEFLKKYPGTIQVGIWPNPDVVPAISIYGENYTQNGTEFAYYRGETILVILAKNDVVNAIEIR